MVRLTQLLNALNYFEEVNVYAIRLENPPARIWSFGALLLGYVHASGSSLSAG